MLAKHRQLTSGNFSRLFWPIFPVCLFSHSLQCVSVHILADVSPFKITLDQCGHGRTLQGQEQHMDVYMGLLEKYVSVLKINLLGLTHCGMATCRSVFL